MARPLTVTELGAVGQGVGAIVLIGVAIWVVMRLKDPAKRISDELDAQAEASGRASAEGPKLLSQDVVVKTDVATTLGWMDKNGNLTPSGILAVDSGAWRETFSITSEAITPTGASLN